MTQGVVRFVENLAFIGKSSSNHWVPMDSNLQGLPPAAATTPKELVLLALGGCTGMDVASILSKRRVSFRKFEIALAAELAEEHPRVFTRIDVTYRFEGDEVPLAELERAIKMSQEKYCAVSAMLRKAAPIRWTAEVNGQKVLEGSEAAT
jgi:putative redox protein